MLFTSNAKELVLNPLHSRIPFNYILRNTWLNLSLDVAGFFNYCFKIENFSLDGIIVHSHCRIRRIFTMKGAIMDSTDMDDTTPGNDIETLPKSVGYPMGVTFYNQLMLVIWFVSDEVH